MPSPRWFSANLATNSRPPRQFRASQACQRSSSLPPMIAPRPKRKKRNDGYLKGQLLVAMPLMTDRRFARSVIYLCAHSDDGAMGLIINHRASHISFPDLLERLGIAPRGADDGISNEILERQGHVGGPGEAGRGFVLPTSDYFSSDSTLQIDRHVSLT